MKRITALFLMLAMLVSLTACGSSAPAKKTVSEMVTEPATEPTAEPTTEPTLSAEERFIQSLPEKLQEAYRLGIVDLAFLENSERLCAIGEAAEILQNIYRIKFGLDSWMLTNAVTQENAAEPATRGWFMTQMYAADAESLAGIDESKTYAVNLNKLTSTQKKYGQDIADALLGEQTNTGYLLVENKKGIPEISIAAYGQYSGASGMVTDKKDFDGDIVVISYALTRYDRTDGEKLMTWDEEKKLRFLDEMTVQEVVETALRYFRALESKETVLPEDVASFDKTIITPELLSRESTLPEASCSHLPAEWHGIAYTHTASLQELPLEHEIQVIKDAGFNYIHYSVNFTHFYGFVPEDGKIHEGRLRELDQLLAWCMERDIHLNLECSWNYDWPNGFDGNWMAKQEKYARSLADSWKVLARRYADIPNKYLSFTPMWIIMSYQDQIYCNYLSPSIDAIREVSPERCIIANVGEGKTTGEALAEKGVALASSSNWSNDFLFTNSQLRSYSLKKIIAEAQWPYEEQGQLVDAAASMANAREDAYTEPIPPDDTAAVAKQYGVGYMIREWGPRIINGPVITEQQRYADETMHAYLTDMSLTMKERGYGWCYTNWKGCVGIAYCYPLVEDSTYTLAAGDCLYVDEEMLDWFQEINGVQ